MIRAYVDPEIYKNARKSLLKNVLSILNRTAKKKKNCEIS